jgi:hypothetical protein
MRPLAATLASFLLAAALAPTPAPAQNRGGPQGNGQPPHAWLFGTWTGGMFPAPSSLNAEACLGQPVVIFTRDLVMRAVLTDQTYIQRVIETARSDANGAEFRFTAAEPQSPPGSGGLLNLGPTTNESFSCDNPDVLHVRKRTENEITFPGCADFPYPLIRCPSH